MKVMLLFILYNNKFDELINSSNKENVIWQPVRNAIGLQAQFAKPEVRIASNFKLEKEAIEDLVGNKFDINISL